MRSTGQGYDSRARATGVLGVPRSARDPFNVRDDLPSGTVTFLFTDVERSTKLLHDLGGEGYATALAEHRRLIRESCAAHGGVEVDTQGDAFFFAFSTAPGALTAAGEMTEALASGPIQVRIGLHTGMPLLTDEGYVGNDVHFAARVAASGHGGQIILSSSTAALIEPSGSEPQALPLLDLGEHRLKDIEAPVAILQLGDGSFPPLKTISNTNLPRPASSFVGRDAELSEVLSRIEGGARLVTLTGPGGSGKTRLAIEVAASLVPEYKAGVFWVGLASLRDPTLVTETVAQTLGAKNGLAEHIGERELLLLLDNLEQVIEAAPELASLLASCPNLALLVTSRELLRVQGEVEYPVPPLAEPEAVSLFCARAQAEPSEEIAELCVRLDSLPLAVELAAARAKALSPAQILERLSQRLDLLKGGRDADPRQQTLRATIEWSYDLLTEDEKQLFRRLSVFAGGCTLEAAEDVADADLDSLQSLVEKSLLRFSNERYWMLETIREYAASRLESAGDRERPHSRHAEWVAELARRGRSGFSSAQREWSDRFDSERDNLRVAIAWCLHNERHELAHELAMAYGLLAANRGPLSEGRTWLDMVLRHTRDVSPSLRQRALRSAASLAERQRDHETARRLAEESLGIAREIGHPDAMADALLALGVVEGGARNFERSELLEREALALFTASGDERQVRATLGLLAWVAIARGRFEEAQELCEEALRLSREAGDDRGVVLAVGNLGHALAKQGKLDEALRLQIETLQVAHKQLDLGGVADTLIEIASIGVLRRRHEQAAVMLGASAALHEKTESQLDLVSEEMQRQALGPLQDELGSDALAAAMGRGREMQLDQIVAYAVEFIDSSE
jgi:predicted ATPase/class 3 adenylate cyclase